MKTCLSLSATLFLSCSSLFALNSIKVYTSDSVDVTSGVFTVYTDTGTDCSAILRTSNASGHDITAKVKRITNYQVGGTANAFCWGLTCEDSLTDVSGDNQVIPAKKWAGALIGNYYPHGNAGTTSITYVFFDIDSTSDTAFVTVHYIAQMDVGIATPKDNGELFSVYPNPANEYVSLDCTQLGAQGAYVVKLYDALGRVAKTIPVRSSDNAGKMQISLAGLSEGIYTLALFSGEGAAEVKRLIIQ